MTRLTVIQGDITTLAVDAIVNAANTSLLGGGGVDGAIHRKAGPELAIACRMLNGCKVGNAKITAGFRLPAKYVIHAVGPVWQGGDAGERDLLASCYQRSLELARDNDLRNVAFPAISTGIFAYPKPAAAKVAVETVEAFVEGHPDALDEITFCAFDAETAELLTQAVEGKLH